jgi:copper resistance protein B
MTFKALMLTASLLPTFAMAMAGHDHEADPLLSSVTIDRLEVGNSDGNVYQAWDMSLGLGWDINKFLLRSEGSREDGHTEDAEWRLQWQRGISPYWDLVAGVRQDSQPHPDRSWLELGVRGLAPYFVESELSLFVGADGRSALRVDLQREFLLSQRWVLVPEVELDLHGHNDKLTGTGSGLSTLEAGIRLHYQVKREFSPYIGLTWDKAFGNTADFQKGEGADSSSVQVLMGINFWY